MGYRDLNIKQTVPGDIDHVMADLRPRDLQEIMPVSPQDSIADVADRYQRMAAVQSGEFLTVWYGGEPVALLMIVSPFQGFGVAGFVATKKFHKRLFVALRRFVLDELRQRLMRAGYRRVEVRVKADYTQSRTVIAAMGGRFDCRLKQFGKSGEEYAQYHWLRDAA